MARSTYCFIARTARRRPAHAPARREPAGRQSGPGHGPDGLLARRLRAPPRDPRADRGQGAAPRPPGRFLLGDRRGADPPRRVLRLVPLSERHPNSGFRTVPAGYAGKRASSVAQIYQTRACDRVALEASGDGRRRRRPAQPLRASTSQTFARRLRSTRPIARQLTEAAIMRSRSTRHGQCSSERGQSRRSAARPARFARRCCAQAAPASAQRRCLTPAIGSKRSFGSTPRPPIFFYGARMISPEATAPDWAGRERGQSAYQSALENTAPPARFDSMLALIVVSLALDRRPFDRGRAGARRSAGAADRTIGRCGAARPPGAISRARAGLGERATRSATLGSTFNRMTRRLEEQTGDLVSANAQLDSRRAFTEGRAWA